MCLSWMGTLPVWSGGSLNIFSSSFRCRNLAALYSDDFLCTNLGIGGVWAG